MSHYTEKGIKSYLKSESLFKQIIIYPTLDSTNEKAKELSREGKTNFAVLARTQSAGRGQGQHSFFSPKGAGIYLSLAIRPKIDKQELSFITLMSALCVREALENTCGISAKLKYVNDVMLSGKKLCGILTEAAFCAERLEYVVVGIGLNVKKAAYPEAIAGLATNLEEQGKREVDEDKLIAQIINSFEKRLSCFNSEKIKEEYSLYLIDPKSASW